MENWGQWDGKKGGYCPKLSDFSTNSLLFLTNSTHFLHISRNILLVISHNSPFSSTSPHFPPFPPNFLHFSSFPPISPQSSISPIFPSPRAGWLIGCG